MPKKNTSKYAIMGMLSIRPMSGYNIKKMIERSIGYFWNESFGQIYPTLKKLVAERLATQHTEKQVGKPDRHIYTLTDAGRVELQRWLCEPAEPEVVRHELLLKLFFGQQISIADNIQHIQRYREQLSAEQQLCRDIETFLKTERAEDPNRPYWLMNLNYGMHAVDAAIRWCDESLETLNQLAEDDSATSV